MSQPLTGIVRRRLHEVSIFEGWFLMAMADMVDSRTQEWREPWPRLALRLGRKNQWCIRQVAYRLRDHGWLSIRSDGRGVTLHLHPNQGKPTAVASPEVANAISDQVANGIGDQVANRTNNQVANGVGPVDRPLINPVGGNAPKTPALEGRKGGSTTGKSGVKASAPVSSDSPESFNGVHKPLSPTEQISLEGELKDAKSALKSIVNSYDDHMDWTHKDIGRARQLKVCIAEIKVRLGRKA